MSTIVAMDGVLTVVDPDTGIFGAGASIEDAIRDFGEALRDHLDVLSREPVLSPALQRQLDLLCSYFDQGIIEL